MQTGTCSGQVLWGTHLRDVILSAMLESTHAKPVPPLSPTWRDRIILLIVLAAGTALTLLAGSSLQQAEVLRTKERQSTATHAVVSVFNLELARTTEAVRNAALMLETNPQLTREQFNRYMQKMVESQLSVNLMEWQPIVPASQLAQFEAAAQTAGLTNFRVVQPDASGTGWEPVHGRDEYVPVLFAWPQSYRTEGLDMSFSPQRMASKLQSRAVAQPVASGTFEFMKEGAVKSGSMAMAISTAVFGADQIARGYLAAVVDLATLFQQATRLADMAKFDLLVFDSTTPEAAPVYVWRGADSDLTQLGTSLNLATANDPGEKVKFAHQAWKLVLHPRPAFYAQEQQNGSRLAFAAGMGMTLMLMLVIFRLQISRRNMERAESVASAAGLALEEAQRIAHVGSWQMDVTGQQVVWSDELYRIHGLPPGSAVPVFTEAAKLLTAESWERVSAAVARALESGTPYQLELETVKPDGSHGWVLAHGEPVRDASGAMRALRGTATDVTERKLAADALRTSEENLSITLNSIGDAVIATDPAGCITRMNPTAERLTGWTLSDAIDRPLAEVFRIVNATTRETVADPVQLVMAQGQVVGLANHTVLLAKDGREYQISDSAAPIRNAAGAIVGVVLVFSDVTQKYQIDTALHDSELRFRSYFELPLVGIAITSLEKGWLDVNQRLCDLLAYPREELMALTWPDITYPDDLAGDLTEYERVLTGQTNGYSLDKRFVRKDGVVIYASIAVSCVRKSDGSPDYFVALVQDIDARKRAEQALIESEERWKFAIEGAGDGLWDWNVQTGVAFYSPRYKAMYGYVDADFGTTSDEWSSRIHPEDAPGVFAALQPYMEGKPGSASVEFRMLCKDGSWKWTLGRGIVVSRDTNGKPLRMIGTNADISERKQNEKILQQSLKDKQALLMEVHHRVKNNLQVISSLLRLETRRSTQAETKTVLTDMQGRIRSMAVLHESLYRSGTFASVDLGSYLRQLASQAFRAQQSGHNNTVRLALDLASVSVGMDQAIPCGLLVNELISNCLKHGFPQECIGEVKISLKPAKPESSQADALWRLCVSDNGVGLSPDFEVKRKTSLGLQLVVDLSHQIGGTLAIDSRHGEGSEFAVTFKAMEPVALVVPT